MSYIKDAHSRFRAATERVPPQVSINPTAGEYDDLAQYVENFHSLLTEFVHAISVEAEHGGADARKLGRQDLLNIIHDAFGDFIGPIKQRAEELRGEAVEGRVR